MESTAYQIALEGLPLMPRDPLGPAWKETFGRYGKALDVQLCTDTSSTDFASVYERLEHEVHLEVHGKKRIILARWLGWQYTAITVIRLCPVRDYKLERNIQSVNSATTVTTRST
ncbi:hypothetical protein DFQ28_000441 [Apophysomyces sp. BC1034]|nr:hypothetical protein DFQ30_000446 [Apophysomyces sp. BC1015]KAG0191324.1 hypothetical protein DFQ28_000441 [Apophysomyces sp. BC1034]